MITALLPRTKLVLNRLRSDEGCCLNKGLESLLGALLLMIVDWIIADVTVFRGQQLFLI